MSSAIILHAPRWPRLTVSPAGSPDPARSCSPGRQRLPPPGQRTQLPAGRPARREGSTAAVSPPPRRRPAPTWPRRPRRRACRCYPTGCRARGKAIHQALDALELRAPCSRPSAGRVRPISRDQPADGSRRRRSSHGASLPSTGAACGRPGSPRGPCARASATPRSGGRAGNWQR